LPLLSQSRSLAVGGDAEAGLWLTRPPP
jgi:hypothetical protein